MDGLFGSVAPCNLNAPGSNPDCFHCGCTYMSLLVPRYSGNIHPYYNLYGRAYEYDTFINVNTPIPLPPPPPKKKVYSQSSQLL